MFVSDLAKICVVAVWIFLIFNSEFDIIMLQIVYNHIISL